VAKNIKRKKKGKQYTWTESAVKQKSAEVEKAGLKVQSGGNKTFKVTVVEVKLGVSGIDFVAAVAKGTVSGDRSRWFCMGFDRLT
jgi:hypothetical protein